MYSSIVGISQAWVISTFFGYNIRSRSSNQNWIYIQITYPWLTLDIYHIQIHIHIHILVNRSHPSYICPNGNYNWSFCSMWLGVSLQNNRTWPMKHNFKKHIAKNWHLYAQSAQTGQIRHGYEMDFWIWIWAKGQFLDIYPDPISFLAKGYIFRSNIQHLDIYPGYISFGYISYPSLV